MSTLYVGAIPIPGSSSTSTGVLLTRLQALGYEREPMFQGPDYLCTTHTLRVRALYNPEVNPYSFTPSPPAAGFPAANLATMAVAFAGAPSRDAGVMAAIAAAGLPGGLVAVSPGMARGVIAPLTDVALRHFLIQPRRQLVYAVGPTPVLVSPGTNSDGSAANRDAYNGPICLQCDVAAISGTKTFIVDLTYQTYVNEMLLFASPNTVLLSHRWSATEDIDQDYYATRTIKGSARFRSDRLAFLGGAADDFRNALFQPLPGVRWKRTLANIEASEDGTALNYVLVDRELAFGIVPEHVTRIEAWQTVGSNLPLHLQSVIGVGADVLQKWVTSDVGFGQHLATAGFGLLGSMIPLLETTLSVRVWGDSRAFRTDLQNTAIGIILARIRLMNQDIGATNAQTEFQLTHDLNGTFVEANCKKVTSFTNAINDGIGGGNLAVLPDVAQYFPNLDDDTPDYIEYGRNSQLQRAGLPKRVNIANGTGSRANWVVRLATAALLPPDTVPISPPPTPPVSTAPASDAIVVDRSPP